MTRQQKRKMERNSKKKQTSMFNIFSISMVDTKSIIEQKSQFILTEEANLKNHLKKNLKLMETKVLVNFGSETQSNFGIISIIHELLNDTDFNKLFNSAVDSISDMCSKLNFESVLQGLSEIDLINCFSKELVIDSSKSIKEDINYKTLQTVIELINFNKKVIELEAA
jgi:ATP-dependent protease HslVU (ClpYQ) peptidase subunit